MHIPRFEELAVETDDSLETRAGVVVGAALVAKDFDVDVDVGALLSQLGELARPLVAEKIDRLEPRAQAEAVSRRFRELGFRGNADDYYAPENSLLHRVLERRTGIPITLSIVWCDLARRAGVFARGVGFPGHFLARIDVRSESIVVDPFGGGRIVDDEVASGLLRHALGDGATLHASLFEPATPRATLVRLLTNLKAIWANRGEHTRAFVAIDRIVALLPDSGRMLRERAAIALRLGIHELARRDLTRVLELEPLAPDVPQIERRLAELSTKPRPPLN